MKKDNDNRLPQDLEEKVREVMLDNNGKPDNDNVTGKDITDELRRLNPDKNSCDRG